MEEYPSLFADSEIKKWGILCGRGWEGLIRQICEKLKETDVIFTQIKEKYGELRISVENGDEEIWKYLLEMEEKAMKICEECGGPGNLADSDGWLFTMCEECAKREAQEYTWVEEVQQETMVLELDKFCRTVLRNNDI
ncbi:uncharacterized protein EV420DRAFT_213706 [Desarmillaria tabescens]|uniref:Uncharacterized protein n=1 Tax=Armillaria tabescens TaxID=1929756 RepID=A0AA39N7L8_ARMTA|nr:uncharacterized protein EV420DRAFT_213706 [Desarmillaria tabescens]KAK0460519.1 hypothetical protein EV420DRAFT_213706 [Desarmillaria tabescens]